MWLFIGCLLITIIIHELAHMLTALYFKVGVKAFSIGFGKPIWHKVYKGIDFRICPILFGGYCDIKGMESKNDPDDFLAQPYRIKFAILVAGGSVNILLALICYLINYGSISYGIYIDWMLIKTMFSQNMLLTTQILVGANAVSVFLIQLTIMNFFCGITNLFPIPALDGGHLWMVLLEKVWKENFIKYYTNITKICFGLLMLAQIIILLLVWS